MAEKQAQAGTMDDQIKRFNAAQFASSTRLEEQREKVRQIHKL
jgi:hypothetical protein